MKSIQKNRMKRDTRKPSSHYNWYFFLGIFLLGLVTTIVFFPALDNQLTNWDDRTYILENEYIKNLSGENISKMFATSTSVSANYHPLTILSLGVNYHFTQLAPRPYILTNIIIHILNGLLVFWFIYLLCKNFSVFSRKINSKTAGIVAFIVTLLFAIHPMHVESVAWISERKDVLYTFFFIGGLISYLFYLKALKSKATTFGKKAFFYGLTFILFVLSCLSKSAAVPFPLVLLLIDFYCRKEVKTLRALSPWVIEKLPFLAFSFWIGWVALQTQSNAIGVAERYGILERMTFASYGTFIYLWKLFFPTNLAAFYPRPDASDIPFYYYAAIPAVLALVAGLIWSLKKTKLWFLGFGFFFLMIALVLQFMTVGGAIYADRYTYVPYIGLFFIIAVEAVNFYQKKGTSSLFKNLLLGGGLLYFLAFTYLSRERTKVWKNSETLWTDTIEKYPSAARAYLNRGEHYYEAGEYEKALADYQKNLEREPNNSSAFMNIGMIYFKQGKYQQAVEQHNQAIALKADYSEAYRNRGNALYNLKQYEKALADFERATALNPRDFRAFNNQGNIHFLRGNAPKAIEFYTKGLTINPNNEFSWGNRGAVHLNNGNYQQAIFDLSKAISIAPNNSGFWLNRAKAYQGTGNKNAALQDAQRAKELGQQVSQAFLNQLK